MESKKNKKKSSKETVELSEDLKAALGNGPDLIVESSKLSRDEKKMKRLKEQKKALKAQRKGKRAMKREALEVH